jgi:hypothetical protein
MAEVRRDGIYVAGDCGGQQWIFAEPVPAA